MRRSPSGERVLATVLFTDVVGSTELAARLGDRRWEDLRRRHNAVVRRALREFGGREIDTAGDGFFATFDRPAQAIRCALAVVEPLRALGLEIRAGIHIGEIEMGREKVGGIAVHTGARVLGEARPGEVLVTAMVRELVAGSGIEFEDRGTATLKGIPGEWRLFSVRAPDLPTTIEPDEDTGKATSGAGDGRHVPRIALGGLAVAVIALAAVATMALLPSLVAGPVLPAANTVGRIPRGATSFDLAVRVGSRPTSVAIGEGGIWVVNFNDQTLSRIDPVSGQVAANPAVGGSPTGLAVGAGAVWVTTAFGTADGAPGSVIRFDPRLGQRVAEVPVRSGTAAIAVGEAAVWVADRLRDALIRVDPRTNATREIPVGRTPDAVAVGHGSVWVTSVLDRAVWRIAPVAPFEVQARISLTGAPTAVAAGEDAVWVTSEAADTVTRIDPATGAVRTTIEVGNGPRGVAASAEAVWVAVGTAGRVVRIDPGSGTITAEVEVDGVPEGIAVDEEGAAWVSVHAP